MKKTLVLASLLAAFGAASAQTSVTMYGFTDQGVGRGTTAGNRFESNPGTSDVGGIRFGVKGTEALGGGLNAKFQIELGDTNGDDGSTKGATFMNRAAWVGFGTDAAELRFGRHYRGSLVAADQITNFGWRGTSSQGNGIGLRGTIDTTTTVAGVTTGSIANSSRYSAPITLIGSAAGLAYSLQFVTSADGTAGNPNLFDLGVKYAAGPLSLGLGYAKANGATGNYTLGASYAFGATTVGFGMMNPEGASKGMTLRVKQQMGAIAVGAEYTKNSGLGLAGFELGMDYSLSARTALTAALNSSTNKQTGYFFGVRHSF